MNRKSNNESGAEASNFDPNPLALRMCHCECGHSFQPFNTRKIYLNKKHADYAYNNGKRKEIQKDQYETEKILRKNNRVCRKYFEVNNNKETSCFLESIVADGLNLSFTIGHSEIDGKIYYHTYNFLFHLFEEDGYDKIKIRKQ